MNNLDDYRGRLLARAFHDELEKLSEAALAPAVPLASKTKVKGGTGVPTAGSPGPSPLKLNLGGAGAKRTAVTAAPQLPLPKTVPVS